MTKRPAAEDRPTWDQYFMRITSEVANRSTCLRRRVGAVLVLNKRILATGYNGAPSGLSHCAEVGCLREAAGVPSGQRHELCRGLHAEQNAMLQAARYGIRIEGATLYSTHVPCSMCPKMAINSGVGRIVATADYPDELARDLLTQAGIELVVFHEDRRRRGRQSESGAPDESAAGR